MSVNGKTIRRWKTGKARRRKQRTRVWIRKALRRSCGITNGGRKIHRGRRRKLRMTSIRSIMGLRGIPMIGRNHAVGRTRHQITFPAHSAVYHADRAVAKQLAVAIRDDLAILKMNAVWQIRRNAGSIDVCIWICAKFIHAHSIGRIASLVSICNMFLAVSVHI